MVVIDSLSTAKPILYPVESSNKRKPRSVFANNEQCILMCGISDRDWSLFPPSVTSAVVGKSPNESSFRGSLPDTTKNDAQRGFIAVLSRYGHINRTGKKMLATSDTNLRTDGECGGREQSEENTSETVIEPFGWGSKPLHPAHTLKRACGKAPLAIIIQISFPHCYQKTRNRSYLPLLHGS